jgi:hypothetical protein
MAVKWPNKYEASVWGIKLPTNLPLPLLKSDVPLSLQIAYFSNLGSSWVVFLKSDLSFDFLMVVKEYEEAC